MNFKERAREAADDATQNCGEYTHLCSKWYLKGAEWARKEIVAELAEARKRIAELEAVIKRVHDDEETGHWGPDITMKAILNKALNPEDSK